MTEYWYTSAFPSRHNLRVHRALSRSATRMPSYRVIRLAQVIVKLSRHRSMSSYTSKSSYRVIRLAQSSYRVIRLAMSSYRVIRLTRCNTPHGDVGRPRDLTASPSLPALFVVVGAGEMAVCSTQPWRLLKRDRDMGWGG